MSKRIDTYKTNELLSETLFHAASAACEAYDLKYVHIQNQGWEEAAAHNCEVIKRLHHNVVECMQYFASFAQECGRPLARANSQGKDFLTINEGNWRKVSVAEGMIMDALRKVTQQLRDTVQSDFSSENPLTNEVADEVDQKIRQSQVEGALEPVAERVKDINLITSYFLSKQGPASCNRSAELFPAIQAKFLAPKKAM